MIEGAKQNNKKIKILGKYRLTPRNKVIYQKEYGDDLHGFYIMENNKKLNGLLIVSSSDTRYFQE